MSEEKNLVCQGDKEGEHASDLTSPVWTTGGYNPNNPMGLQGRPGAGFNAWNCYTKLPACTSKRAKENQQASFDRWMLAHRAAACTGMGGPGPLHRTRADEAALMAAAKRDNQRHGYYAQEAESSSLDRLAK